MRRGRTRPGSTGSSVPIWYFPTGKTFPFPVRPPPNREITVTFGNTALKTKTDSKGKWSVTLPPHASLRHRPDAGGRAKRDSAKLEDVLVGEVWLASGQSNMLFRLNQTTTAKEDIAASGDDQLRLLNNVPQAHTNNAPYSAKDFDAVTTDNFYKGQWAASSPATSGPMTAVGYYFGKKSPRRAGHSGRHHPLLPGRLGNRSVDPPAGY